MFCCHTILNGDMFCTFCDCTDVYNVIYRYHLLCCLKTDSFEKPARVGIQTNGPTVRMIQAYGNEDFVPIK